MKDSTALTWVARLFLAIGIGAAIVCGALVIETRRFISESVQSEGTVVDWTQDQGAVPSLEPGAYYRIIEVLTPEGRTVRGHADVGVDMNQLEIGERLTVRYRPGDPARMRVATLSGLWLREMVSVILAIAFGSAGAFFLKQAKE